MSYNITTWKTKTLQDFTIPLAAVHALPDVRVELLPNGEVKATGLAEGFELGGTWDSISLLRVTSLKLLGDGSGFVWEYLLTALKQSKGSLVAVQIWEGGDTITRLTVVDGDVKEEKSFAAPGTLLIC
jgi:hypothetical protein